VAGIGTSTLTEWRLIPAVTLIQFRFPESSGWSVYTASPLYQTLTVR
jgi:hypothetical protein